MRVGGTDLLRLGLSLPRSARGRAAEQGEEDGRGQRETARALRRSAARSGDTRARVSPPAMPAGPRCRSRAFHQNAFRTSSTICLGVAEQHHRVVPEEELVLDAGIARPHASLDEQYGAGTLHVEDRHAVDRALRVVLGGRVGHVVRADYEGDVGSRKVVVDVVELEHLAVRYVGLGEEDVHVSRHAPGHRVDGVANPSAVRLQAVPELAQRVLRLRDRHPVAGDDDERVGVLQDERRVLRAALLHRARLADGDSGHALGLGAESAEDDAHERSVHAPAHDVGEDRARRADQGAGDDEGGVLQGEADAGRRPPGVGVEHRHHDRHVRPADRDDDEHADDEGEAGDEPESLVRLGPAEPDGEAMRAIPRTAFRWCCRAKTTGAPDTSP